MQNTTQTDKNHNHILGRHNEPKLKLNVPYVIEQYFESHVVILISCQHFYMGCFGAEIRELRKFVDVKYFNFFSALEFLLKFRFVLEM